jgi:hypothetical protein
VSAISWYRFEHPVFAGGKSRALRVRVDSWGAIDAPAS